jgi:hypothetical protein
MTQLQHIIYSFWEFTGPYKTFYEVRFTMIQTFEKEEYHFQISVNGCREQYGFTDITPTESNANELLQKFITNHKNHKA